MAYGVSTQWDDIHIKLGNYPEREKIKPQSEFSKEAIVKMEEHVDSDEELRELMEDDLLDDDFLESYKAKRLQQMENQ